MALDEDIVMLIFSAMYWKGHVIFISLYSTFAFLYLEDMPDIFFIVVSLRPITDRVVSNTLTLGPGSEAPLRQQM